MEFQRMMKVEFKQSPLSVLNIGVFDPHFTESPPSVPYCPGGYFLLVVVLDYPHIFYGPVRMEFQAITRHENHCYYRDPANKYK